jgi:hypothetical protein
MSGRLRKLLTELLYEATKDIRKSLASPLLIVEVYMATPTLLLSSGWYLDKWSITMELKEGLTISLNVPVTIREQPTLNRFSQLQLQAQVSANSLEYIFNLNEPTNAMRPK